MDGRCKWGEKEERRRKSPDNNWRNEGNSFLVQGGGGGSKQRFAKAEGKELVFGTKNEWMNAIGGNCYWERMNARVAQLRNKGMEQRAEVTATSNGKNDGNTFNQWVARAFTKMLIVLRIRHWAETCRFGMKRGEHNKGSNSSKKTTNCNCARERIVRTHKLLAGWLIFLQIIIRSFVGLNDDNTQNLLPTANCAIFVSFSHEGCDNSIHRLASAMTD